MMLYYLPYRLRESSESSHKGLVAEILLLAVLVRICPYLGS